MHETAIARKIIEEAESHGKVSSLRLEVGELCNVTAEELAPCIRAMVSWDVKAETRESLVKCACGYRGRARIAERGHDFCLYECPECGSVPEVVEGNEIRIVSVGVE